MPKLREMEPVDADYPFTGPTRRQLRQPIATSAETLFRCLVDGPAWKRWLGIDVEWTSTAPYGVGTTRTVTTAGQTIEEYFVRWDDGERMTFRFERSTLPVAAFAEDYHCVTIGPGACELVWSYAYEWDAPLPRVTGAVFGATFALKSRRALKKLARLLETEGDAWAE